MRRTIFSRRTCLNLVSAFILLAGLCCSAWIYRTAGSVPGGVSGYEEAGGTVYPINPEDSRKFIRAMEQYGGKSNLLAYELNAWFTGLWHGKKLACSVALISVLMSLAAFFAAFMQGTPGASPGDEAREKDRAGP